MLLTNDLHKGSKIKLFTHNDLDGIGCEILGRLAFTNIDVTTVRNPNEASIKVGEFVSNGEFLNYDKIFITDISVDEATANLIDDLEWESHRFALLDHHGTADYLNKYEWASVQVKGRMGKEAGTNLFFEYLVMSGFFVRENYRDALTIFVEKVRRYDCWEWKDIYNDEEALELNTLFFLLGRKDFVNNYIRKFKNINPFIVREGSWIQMFDKSDRTIIEVDNRKKDAYIKRKEKQMIAKKLLGHKVGVVFAEQYISELGNVLSENNPDLKFIIMIDMGSRKVSYRTVHNDIDLGRNIAQVFGGGGHAKASGSTFSSKVADHTFNLVFGLGLIGFVKKFLDKFSK